jgi:hypothetical protein
LKSRSNFLRVSPIAVLLKAMCPRYEGKPNDRVYLADGVSGEFG